MEKLGQLLQGTGGILSWSTPAVPERTRLSRRTEAAPAASWTARLWKLLLAPGRSINRIVTGAVGLAMKAMSTVLGSQMLSDASQFVNRSTRRSVAFVKGGSHIRIAQAPGYPVRRGVAAEPDALRENPSSSTD